jgi:iron complex transport system substrate-binding protein
VEREVGTGRVGSVWVAGPETFYDDIVRLAGGVNAFQGGGAVYPEVSREGLLHLDPDVILDVVADIEARALDRSRLAADWRAHPELRAVREGRVHLLTEGYEVIPGPRVTRTVEEVARLLHPEAALEMP